MLNNLKRGSLRDSEILRLIESQTCMNTDQIRLLLFNGVTSQVCNRRLLSLVKSGRLKRNRYSINEPYYYYLNKKPGQVEHVLGISWAYVWIAKTLKSWESLHGFEREVTFKILRSDGLISIKNNITGEFRFLFLEMDIAESGNPFKKAELYDYLYSSEGYLGKWFSPLLKRFPPVIVITTDKIKKIKERIGDSEVEFRVYSLESIKEACFNGSSGTAGIRTI